MGSVDTRTYNPVAGYEAFLEAKAKAKVVPQYGDPTDTVLKDTERKGLSPGAQMISVDLAYFEAQPTLRDTSLRIFVPFYAAYGHFRAQKGDR